MITPAYSPTATERVLPRLALDFTTGVLDPRVTVARALNTATRVNSSGLVEGVNADLPRFDYDPVTLAPKGLLIEEARTNILLRSTEFNNASWVKSNSTITADAITSPDGSANADKLIPTAAATDGRVIQAIVGSAGTTYTLSVYSKQAEFTNCRLYADDGSSNLASVSYNLATGAIVTAATVNGTWTSPSSTITSVGNGWWRLTLTWTATGAAPTRAIYWCRDTGNGTSGIYIWGAQLEAGAFATSYIPTTTTSLTRNADQVSMTGTNLTSWLDATQGTLLSEHMVSQFNPANTIFAYSLGSSAGVEVYTGIQTTGVNQFTVQNTTNQANFAGFAAGVVNVPQKVCGYFKENNFAASANGSPASTDTLGTVPSINKLIFGARNDGARVLNGWARKFAYWPFTLTTAEVTAFSKQ